MIIAIVFIILVYYYLKFRNNRNNTRNNNENTTDVLPSLELSGEEEIRPEIAESLNISIEEVEIDFLAKIKKKLFTLRRSIVGIKTLYKENVTQNHRGDRLYNVWPGKNQQGVERFSLNRSATTVDSGYENFRQLYGATKNPFDKGVMNNIKEVYFHLGHLQGSIFVQKYRTSSFDQFEHVIYRTLIGFPSI
ncbi:hypothetical protein RND71_014571 [Anisodus tanguticus]|uniref:Uncharacterized protein n=1 Tax=Anisodus tanguticus TaxID=243964 RepID=A0AAE1SBI0_9SOLA|nr:hypothetical protein RND71_014571 [Anisodus tanguticus]